MPSGHVVHNKMVQIVSSCRGRGEGEGGLRTCSCPSLVRARWAKMSRIRAVRSATRTPSPSARSRLRCCPGLSSSSKMTVSTRCASTAAATSASLPLPRYVAAAGLLSDCDAVPTTYRPAVRARLPSSSRDSSTAPQTQHGSRPAERTATLA